MASEIWGEVFNFRGELRALNLIDSVNGEVESFRPDIFLAHSVHTYSFINFLSLL